VVKVSVSPQAPRATGLLLRFDPAGLLYGAVVSAATLGVLAHADESTRVAIATSGVLLVYWSAHVYIHAFSKQLTGEHTGLFIERTRESAREELGVLVGGLPAVAVYVVLVAVGVHPPTAGYISLLVVVVLLFTVGYLGAIRAGLTRRVALVEAVGAGSFGVVIVLMKALLH
jgi:VIT1/CCC1 family predicted Fe2+/Mn2+ transporter